MSCGKSWKGGGHDYQGRNQGVVHRSRQVHGRGAGGNTEPPVSETEDAGLIYKEYDNNALPAGSEGDADEVSDAPPGIFGDWRDQALAEAMGICLAETRKEMRAERAAEIAPLKTEIAELRGQVSALLTMLGAGDKAK